MSVPRLPEPVFLVIGVLAAAQTDTGEIFDAVSREFGPIECIYPFRPFTETHYYDREMGEGILRGFILLSERFEPDALAGIKLRTNELERRWLRDERRRVNLDPGFLDLGHLILASGKPAGHRVYLRDGIYAEIEYLYQSGSFQTLPWTYPDYLEPDVIAFFNELREAFRIGRKETLCSKA
jgi:hypothetical protein